MKIDRLPSGSYRVRKTVNKKQFSLTFDHKPTKADIEIALADAIQRNNQAHGIDVSFDQAARLYIDSKTNVLSPSTIGGYESILRLLPEWFKNKKIDEIEQRDINSLVNELTKDKSPKTVHNFHGFVSAVFGAYRPSLVISTHLPQKIKKEPYIPSDDEVKAILEHSKGTRYYIPLVLMCYGLRRSEVLALTPEDIEGDIVHINKALVKNKDNEMVIKTTKTTQSTRDIYIPQDVADMIREQGYVYRGSPHRITQYLYETEDKLGIEHFSCHKLRHFFASKLSSMDGISESDILALGGWSTSNVMKTVYRHSMMREKQKKETADKLRNELFS